MITYALIPMLSTGFQTLIGGAASNGCSTRVLTFNGSVFRFRELPGSASYRGSCGCWAQEMAKQASDKKISTDGGFLK